MILVSNNLQNMFARGDHSTEACAMKSTAVHETDKPAAFQYESFAVDCLLSLGSGPVEAEMVLSKSHPIIPVRSKPIRLFNDEMNAKRQKLVISTELKLSSPALEEENSSRSRSSSNLDSSDLDKTRSKNSFLKPKRLSAAGPQRLRIKGPYKDIVNALKYVVEQTKIIKTSPRRDIYSDRIERRRTQQEKLQQINFDISQRQDRHISSDKKIAFDGHRFHLIERFLTSVFVERICNAVATLPETMVMNGVLHFPGLWSLSCATENFSLGQ